MPSPFPGMDPYLESPSRWQDFHTSLIFSISAELAARLPDGFEAIIETDLAIRNSMVSPAVEVHLSRLPFRQRFVQVVRIEEPTEIVTVIEVLSPENKTPGDNYEDYLRKQELLLSSPINLL